MRLKILSYILFQFIFSSLGWASYIPLSKNENTNIGIGTTSPQTKLVVLQGNIGVGTWTAQGGLLIIQGDQNVGIGSVRPGERLDVSGTLRATAFSGSGSSLSGITTTAWSDNGSNVHLGTITYNVGLGTSDANDGRLILLNGNMGIGTKTPQDALVVTNGNVGIGTWNPFGGKLIIRGLGNVGVNSTAPGVMLDVGSGGARVIGLGADNVALQINETAGTHFQLRSSGTSGGSWYIGSSDNSNGIKGGNKLYFSTVSSTSSSGVVFDANSNIGLGTTIPISKLAIVGNIGIGTGKSSAYISKTAPLGGMIIEGNVGLGTTNPLASAAIISGNVGIGTWTAQGGALIVKDGNVGINSSWPGAAIDVNGNVRANNFSGDGSLLTGVTATIGWTDNGSNVHLTTATDNVGIGTSDASQGKLVVTNGNVGIGTFTPFDAFILTQGNFGVATWSPGQLFQVNRPAGPSFSVTAEGNVGVGTISPQGSFVVSSGNMGIGTFTAGGGKLIVMGGGNVGFGTSFPGAILDISNSFGAASQDENSLRSITQQTANTTGTLYANQILVTTSTGTIENMKGYEAKASNTSSGDVTDMIGNKSIVQNTNSGTIGAPISYYGNIQKLSTGAITNARILYGKIDNTDSTNAITNAYGLYLDIGTQTGTISNYYGIYIVDTTERNYFAGNVGLGSTTPGVMLDIFAADDATAQLTRISATSANVTGADTFYSFRSTDGEIGNIVGTAGAGTIAYNTFTGSHWTEIQAVDKNEVHDLYLLCSTGEVVDWDQKQLTKTRLCRAKADPTVLGAFGGYNADGKATVLAIGTGYIIVANKGENITRGDYLMTSDVQGYAERQPEMKYKNYTVAKAMQSINWQPNEQFRKIACIYLSG